MLNLTEVLACCSNTTALCRIRSCARQLTIFAAACRRTWGTRTCRDLIEALRLRRLSSSNLIVVLFSQAHPGKADLQGLIEALAEEAGEAGRDALLAEGAARPAGETAHARVYGSAQFHDERHGVQGVCLL